MTTSAQAAPSQEGSAGWVAYYEHVIVADGQLVAALEGINAAARAGDDAAESRALDDLDSIVDTELTWLHNHEPDACYEDLYQQELDVMAQLQVATAANRQWLVTDDAEDLQALVDAFGGATEGIRAIMSSAQAGETCTPVHEGQAQIGEKVSAGDHFLTVKKVEQWQGSGFLTPGPGNVFITVQIEIEAIRNGQPFVLDSMLVTTTGDGYRRELLGRDPDVVSLPEMRSGDVKSAWFTFEIPRDQRGGLVLDYRVGLTGPSIEIALD